MHNALALIELSAMSVAGTLGFVIAAAVVVFAHSSNGGAPPGNGRTPGAGRTPMPTPEPEPALKGPSQFDIEREEFNRLLEKGELPDLVDRSKPERRPAAEPSDKGKAPSFVFPLVMLLVGAFGLAIVFVRQRGDSGPADIRDWKLTSLQNDEIISMREYSGKVLFVQFWSVDLGTTAAELKSIQRLRQQYEFNDDVKFFAVSVDGSAAGARNFLERNNIQIPAFVTANGIPAPLAIRQAPTTFIIDRDCKIVRQEVGAAQWDLPGVETLLDKLIDQPPAPVYAP